MITTQQLSKELGMSQRSIQWRILKLQAQGAIKAVERVGKAFVLTQAQAQAVRDYNKSTEAK